MKGLKIVKFKKIVTLDNISFTEGRYGELNKYADEVELHFDYPTEDAEKIERIGDADCVLVSWNTRVDKGVIEACKNLKYIGMCCSLYDEASANVDIACAREYGIKVLGVRDYGDQGVAEFVATELIDLLHGFGEHQWKENKIHEITGIKIGIIGLGATGSLVGKTLQMFGGDMYYNDMVRKPEMERVGFKYLPIDELLKTVDVITTHLPKHIRFMDRAKLSTFGNGKIIINPSIGPTYVKEDMLEWLSDKSNFLISEKSSMNGILEDFLKCENFIFTNKVAGMTEMAKERLIDKVLQNIETALKG